MNISLRSKFHIFQKNSQSRKNRLRVFLCTIQKKRTFAVDNCVMAKKFSPLRKNPAFQADVWLRCSTAGR